MDAEWMKRVDTLRSLPYVEYLQTPEWLAKREQALRLAEHRCQVCYSANELHVHHRTYERRGCEALGDLTVLCGVCHELFHGKQRLPLIEEEMPARITEITQFPSEGFSLAHLTFETFPASVHPAAFEAALEWVAAFSGTFIVYGPPGTGKTHLLAAMCNILFGAGHACMFVSAPHFFHSMQEGANRGQSFSIIRQAILTPFLVIDDITLARRTDFREEIYFQIIDERTKRDKPIAIGTNNFDALEDCIGGTCLSRLAMRLYPIELVGEDHRLEM